MANNKKKQERRQSAQASADSADKPVMLKDILGADTLAKLKQQAETMKQEEAMRQEAKRKEAEMARQAEQKLKENDFGYLLDNSSAKGRKYN